MPELPEVETVVRSLTPHLVGRLMRSLVLLDPKLDVQEASTLKGSRIQSIERIGKQIVLSLYCPYGRSPRWLAFHLGMTGQLIWLAEDAERVVANPLKPRAILRLEGGVLFFVDVRRFGRIKLTFQRKDLLTGGIDPFEPDFTTERLASLLRTSRQTVKVWLLRQDRVVGLGNIYVCEALHRAGISPSTAVNSLVMEEIELLRRMILEVLEQAIEHRGTTISDFVDSSGSSGSFQNRLKVYGREGKPCETCGHLVERIPQQGRSTYYCPRCQSAR